MIYIICAVLFLCLHVTYGTLGACGKLGGYRLPAWRDWLVMFALCGAALVCLLRYLGAL